LYVTSTGKFHTSFYSGSPEFLRVICEMPSSGPSRCVQSSPWTMAYLTYALSHPGSCGFEDGRSGRGRRWRDVFEKNTKCAASRGDDDGDGGDGDGDDARAG
jgi:hypothetical protein